MIRVLITTLIEAINLVAAVLIGKIGRDVEMTNEKAINTIKHGCIYRDKRGGEALEVAITALEKQMPKKPDLEGDGYDENGELIYDTWICPCCGKYYEVYYEEYDFCPKCGQAIDWSDSE